MKKHKIFIRLFLTLASFLLIVGCSGDSQNEEASSKNMENDVEEVADTEDFDNGSVEQEDDEVTVDNLFDKTKDIASYYYEVETEVIDEASYTSKVWFTDDQSKIESYYPDTGEKIILLVDEIKEVSYLYMTEENTAIKTTIEGSSAFTNEDSEENTQNYIELLKEIADNEEIQVEDGDFEGQAVKIVSSKVIGNTNKVWLSEKTGFPLKSEFYIDGELDSRSIFKAFEEKTIDPSTFELPEDVQIQDMTDFSAE